MNSRSKSLAIFFFVSILVVACARLEQPRTGPYRGAIDLPGGELPFSMAIETSGEGVQLSILHGVDRQPASGLTVHDRKLNAELPNGAGRIDASMSRKGLSGTLKLGGKTWPFKAVLGAEHRFFKDSATDNADVSGRWRLQCRNAGAPTQLELRQSHDLVDGLVRMAEGAELPIEGQVHGDDVSLGALGAGVALLYKARVDAQGQLQGELWLGDAQQHCAAAPEKIQAEP